MRPVFTVLAKVKILESHIKERCFVLRVRPNQARACISKSYPALLFIPLYLVVAQAQTPYRGTTIVINVTTTEIAIAADSQANKGEKSAGRHYCKLAVANKFVFGVSGFPAYEETGFDVLNVLTAARRPTFTETVGTTEASLKLELLRTLKYIWQKHRSVYKREIKSKVTSFLVAALDGNILRCVWRELGILEDPITAEPQALRIINRIDCPGVQCAVPNFILIGETAEVERLYNEHEQGVNEELPLPVDQVEFLVTLEAIVRKDVGTPVDVVRITKDGIKWIKRKPECDGKKFIPRTKPAEKK